MRDKKDHATLDLPGFVPAVPLTHSAAEAKRTTAARPRAIMQQHQLPLLEETDATGLPVWRRDENTDLTGLPIWAAA